MAYSDYGGYAYRNGKRIVERSDCTIKPNGDTFGTPGMWPGFATIGLPEAERNAQLDWPSGHAVLGDGPIYAVLYKQSTLHLYRGPERIDINDQLFSKYPHSRHEWTNKEGKVHVWFETDEFKKSELPCKFEVDGWKITAYWREEDNHYQYVKLEQPDGTVWHGWSGYGVGAGLEDAGYGYSTPDREYELWSLFPSASDHQNEGKQP